MTELRNGNKPIFDAKIMTAGKRNLGEGRNFAHGLALIALANAFETLDFSSYAFVASTIAKQFFPARDPLNSLLLTLAAFGIGFLARPLGAIVIGRIGDAKGRKPATVLSLILTASGTLAISLLPPYAQIGVMAPILLVAARLVQGFGVGGGAATRFIFVVEWAPPDRRGLYGSLEQAGVLAGFVAGSLICSFAETMLSPAQFDAWGWRTPFIVGALLWPLSLLVRSTVRETPVYRTFASGPLPTLEKTRIANILKAAGLAILWTSVTYICLGFLPTLIRNYTRLPERLYLWTSVPPLLIALLATPLFGLLADIGGRRRVLLFTSVLCILLPLPLMIVIAHSGTYATTVLAQIPLALLAAALFGVCPAALCELFPTPKRALMVSVSYACAVAIFGGFAPSVAVWLIRLTGNATAPAFYVMAAAAPCLLASLSLDDATPQTRLR